MANATITLVLPTTRTDGSAFSASDYGGAHILRDGAKVASITAPALSFVDASLAPGTYAYTASVFDTQTPSVESALSAAVSATVVAVLAAPSAPTLTVVVA